MFVGLRQSLPFFVMDSLSLCWRGMAGAGKTTALHEALRSLAALRGIPFTIQRHPLQTRSLNATGDVTEAAASEEGAGPGDAEAGQFLYESSLVHIGLDIARMSMQDKHILRPVLLKLGQGSQVLAGDQGRGARILVLYHAHLLSSESVLLLQACLEHNEGDLSIWLTSELPMPQRIRDWFIEIPVNGYDRAFENYKNTVYSCSNSQNTGQVVMNWPDVFRALFKRWLSMPVPTLKEVKEVKAIVYEMMMRNLRWVEVVHFILDVVLTMEELSPEQRQVCMKALAGCEATGGGYTIPSYRIPILWESLFLQLRSILCSPCKVDGEKQDSPQAAISATVSPKRTVVRRKKGVANAGTSVAAM
jgi:hypothetical protein